MSDSQRVGRAAVIGGAAEVYKKQDGGRLMWKKGEESDLIQGRGIRTRGIT